MKFPALALFVSIALGILADQWLATDATRVLPLFAILCASFIIAGILLVALQRTKLAWLAALLA
jgi:hypothetical protein